MVLSHLRTVTSKIRARLGVSTQISRFFQQSAAFNFRENISTAPAIHSSPNMLCQNAGHRVHGASRRSLHIESRMEELGMVLPPPGEAKANYTMCVRDGNTLYISGHLPMTPDGLITGRLGENMSTDEGYKAARWVGLNLLSTLSKECGGNLDRVEQVVKLMGLVNSTNDFIEQHLVINGCSDVLMEAFEKPVGYHARSAFGVNTLPLGVAVEIEAIVKLKPEEGI